MTFVIYMKSVRSLVLSFMFLVLKCDEIVVLLYELFSIESEDFLLNSVLFALNKNRLDDL